MSTKTPADRTATAMRILVMLGAVAVAEWWIRVTLQINERGEEAFFIDFVAFWTAAKLALAGEAMTVWNEPAFDLAQNVPRAEDARMPWFYPATWHLAVTPFAALPFSIAWGGFILLSLGLLVAAARRVTLRYWPVAVVCPAVLLTTMLGNNAILFAACLALALEMLMRNRSAGAGPGVLIAVLTMKPSLGLTVPIALAAGGHWRAIAWAAGSALLLAAIATALFGIAHWQAFFAALSTAMDRVTETSLEAPRMISWYALAHYGGFGSIALPLHLALLTTMALLLALLWRRGEAAGDWRAAALMIAVALTSPHAFHYEMVYALAGMAFALRAGIGWAGGLVLALLWIAPMPLLLPFETAPVVVLACPAATLAFGYSTWRGLRG
ncbi:MAG: glycosyltransferase family 87 protein [Pseudomonadota bacterium]